MTFFHENDDDDLRREAIDERRERARLWHWCDVCHGHTGPGSPCYDGPEDEPEADREDDGDNAWFHDPDMGDQ